MNYTICEMDSFSVIGQKKSRRPFSDFLLGMPLCERRIFSFESSGQVVPMCGESVSRVD